MACSLPSASSDRVRERVDLSLTSRSDAQLLADGDQPEETFAVFYQRHVDALIRFAARRGLGPEAAADVVADAMVAALRGRYAYRPEREHARLWLLTIVDRRIIDRLRRRDAEDRRDSHLRNEALVLTESDRASYQQLLEEADERALDALADLPSAQQAAIRARVLGERSYAELAAALGLSQSAARQQVSRGLSALRHKLKDTR